MKKRNSCWLVSDKLMAGREGSGPAKVTPHTQSPMSLFSQTRKLAALDQSAIYLSKRIDQSINQLVFI